MSELSSLPIELLWTSIRHEDGEDSIFGYETVYGEYIGRYTTCFCRPENAFRNRHWTVRHVVSDTSKQPEVHIDGVIAEGWCLGSDHAEKSIKAIISSELRGWQWM